MRIAICDDDVKMTSELEYKLLNFAKQLVWNVEIDIFLDGRELLEYIAQGNEYDLLFLDIEMKDLDGIQTAQALRKNDPHLILIYVTSHESYAPEAFEVNAFRFLTKPVDDEKLERYFSDALKKIEKSPDVFLYRCNKVYHRVLMDEIVYFQSDLRKMNIVTKKGIRTYNDKMKRVESILIGQGVFFYRPNQSYLVNPKYVQMCRYDTMELMDGTVISMSERHRKQVKELFCKLKGEDIVAF